MTELGVGIAKESDAVTAGIVFDGITPVRITFLTDQLFGFDDDAAKEAGLVLMLGDELRGQDRSFFYRFGDIHWFLFHYCRHFIFACLCATVVQGLFFRLLGSRSHLGYLGADTFLRFGACPCFPPTVKEG